MKKTILFALPGNESLTQSLSTLMNAELGDFTLRNFPDGETYVRIRSDVKDKRVIIICALNNPDPKLLPLYFLSQTAKDLGAACTCLVAPYLAYMRQDKQFNAGEGVTSTYFASLISNFSDSLITVDPHLHRRHSMNEIYNVPCQVLHAAPLISKWIRENISQPVLIGPDSESEQWVSAVAKEAEAPFTVLNKIRRGDKDVEVSIPQVEKYLEHTPVLVDDIISTARTMIETIGHLTSVRMRPPVCIGVHGVFSETAYNDLLNAGASKVITTNTISHPSNQIDIANLIADALAIIKNQLA
jgi:ribose-phosphate pyrophosphokinase